MATRRRHFGSVRRLPSGQYQASYWHDGCRHVGPHTFRTKADAWAYLSGVETAIVRGGWVDPRAGSLSVAEYAESWLRQRTDLRPRTVEKYRYLLDRYLLPALGDRPLGRLTTAQVRAWHAEVRRRVPHTAAGAYRLLGAICRTAVADELIARNPCQVKGAGIERSKERPTVTFAELDALVEAMPERLRLLVLMAAWCGLRRGELLGLQRRDVDPLHGSVRVERAVVHMTGGQMYVGEPKTAAGRRTVHYPPSMADEVADHLDRFVAPAPDAWLFPGATGNPLPVKALEQAWTAARRTVGRLDVRLHDLRHTAATWAAISGATTRELMARLGHASPAAALRYQHATLDRDRALAQALAELPHRPAPAPLRPVPDRACPIRPDEDAAPGTGVAGASSEIAHGSRTAPPDATEGRPESRPSPGSSLERTTGLEPATLTLAR